MTTPAPLPGTVGLHGLQVDCVIGIYPHERLRPQPLFIDVELDVDLGPAADSGSIDDATDYEQVAEVVRQVAVGGEHRLLESLAGAASAALLDRFGAARAVRLEIRKPLALDAARDGFVRLERRR